VLGFDDILPSAVSTPSITTIRQPLSEVGLLTADLTLEAMEVREKGSPLQLKLHQAQPELVIRMSTVKLAKKAEKRGHAS
jgi:DNA-binding LacI/PurR family transcriptional regulator